MLNDFFEKLQKIAQKKKTDFRLQQEAVAKQYDADVNAQVSKIQSKTQEYLVAQLNKFEGK